MMWEKSQADKTGRNTIDQNNVMLCLKLRKNEVPLRYERAHPGTVQN